MKVPKHHGLVLCLTFCFESYLKKITPYAISFIYLPHFQHVMSLLLNINYIFLQRHFDLIILTSQILKTDKNFFFELYMGIMALQK